MCSTLSEEEKQLLEDCLVIHTLEKSDDSFLHLDVEENQERVDALIEAHPSDGIVFDVLRDFSVDDLDRDSGMQDTLAVIRRLTRKKNPRCIPICIMQHARTGKRGLLQPQGSTGQSFGRNSKVLSVWTVRKSTWQPMARITMMFSSSKRECNNAPEFAMFAVRRNEVTMRYERDDSVDIEAWREYISSGNCKEPKREWTAEDVLRLLPEKADVTIQKSKIAKAISAGMPVNKNMAVHQRVDLPGGGEGAQRQAEG